MSEGTKPRGCDDAQLENSQDIGRATESPVAMRLASGALQ
ncbi:hypothetical protein BH11MYX4_BH11MYX4_05510 [soil metagenome]